MSETSNVPSDNAHTKAHTCVITVDVTFYWWNFWKNSIKIGKFSSFLRTFKTYFKHFHTVVNSKGNNDQPMQSIFKAFVKSILKKEQKKSWKLKQDLISICHFGLILRASLDLDVHKLTPKKSPRSIWKTRGISTFFLTWNMIKTNYKKQMYTYWILTCSNNKKIITPIWMFGGVRQWH